jgi:CRISPR-associated protein Csx10
MAVRPALLGARTSLTIHTLSDWHVGAGHGVPGGPHALVRRDHDDLPYVPGTTLTGLLRDACLTVAVALDDGAEGKPGVGVWQRWHGRIFGGPAFDGPGEGRAPVASVLGVGPARIPPRLRAALAEEHGLVEALTTFRTGVRIDEKTGRAQDEMLRVVELARGGLPLRAEIFVVGDLDDDDLDDGRASATALVALGAAWCDRMGGDRRRGPGEIRIDVDGHSPTEWARWLRDGGWSPPAPRPPALPVAPPVSAVTDASAEASEGNEWAVLDVTITTLGPIRVPSSAAGNVVRGLDYVPGHMLLPWLSRCWDAGLVASAVAAEAVIARHAHPVVDGVRGLPVPLTASRAKGPSTRVSVGSPEPGQRQVRSGWTVPEPDGDLPLQAGATAQVGHNQVDRARQRPTESTGIYEVEVIPAGRVLRGQVLVTAAFAARLRATHGERWWQVLAGAARFGARRQGEYGSCEVTLGEPRPVAVGEPPQGPFTLLAGSDVLVRDRGLRLSAHPDDVERWLRRRLGDAVALDEVTTRTARREGWQSSWQLPRESLVGLGAGTVLALRVADGARLDPQGWADLIVRGLGARRAEGFGEVHVDSALLAPGSRQVRDIDPRRGPAPAPLHGPLDAVEDAALDLLRRATRKEAIESAVAARRDDAVVAGLAGALGALSRSQRGTWRAVTAGAAAAGSPDRLAEHARAWLGDGTDRRRPQRAMADQVLGLLGQGAGRSVQDLLGISVDDDGRAFAVAALIADAVDALAREEQS